VGGARVENAKRAWLRTSLRRFASFSGTGVGQALVVAALAVKTPSTAIAATMPPPAYLTT
jgi:hypothetical protein